MLIMNLPTFFQHYHHRHVQLPPLVAESVMARVSDTHTRTNVDAPSSSAHATDVVLVRRSDFGFGPLSRARAGPHGGLGHRTHHDVVPPHSFACGCVRSANRNITCFSCTRLFSTVPIWFQSWH